jgi:bacterial/archaeal transporter family-2 protein
MMRMSLPLLPASVVFFIGGALTLQAALNARLGERVGHPLTAAIISFLVGLVALLIAAIAVRVPLPSGTVLASAPWPLWIGGVFGATFIAASVVLVPRVGPGLFFALVIAGQLVASLVIEHYGWLGIDRQPVTISRIAGVLLLVLGVVLIRWRR